MSCGTDAAVRVAVGLTWCSWTTTNTSRSYLVAEVLFPQSTWLNVTFTHNATWVDTIVAYIFSMKAIPTGGEGITDLAKAETVITECPPETFDECEPGTIAHERRGSAGYRYLTGKHLFIFSAFGASTSDVEVKLDANRPFMVTSLETGTSRLTTVPDQHETSGQTVLSFERPAWVVAWPAGRITVEEIVYTASSGANWTFRPFPDLPRLWIAPEQWADTEFVGLPNLGVAAGQLTAGASWSSENGGGIPMIGILDAPFFIEADGRLRSSH